ncbi:hypothetical protein L210DRAFT_3646269 [Boletus edulis BED1]|uniref:Uncharacterized protein n=1 Tax=Boletus edulis BED1 TaxID=1328754 RepID=A0AAD4BTK7_BOLED|nr:hypothetical protein L210DRAFT_3646269 [Boletus edulis BED1]
MLLSEPSIFDIAAAQARLEIPGIQHSFQDTFAPFSNLSSSILMIWQYSGTKLIGFFHTCEEQQMDKYLESKENPFQAEYE